MGLPQEDEPFVLEDEVGGREGGRSVGSIAKPVRAGGSSGARVAVSLRG